MTLATLDILNGVFSMIFVAISTIVGIIIASRYFKYKKPMFIYWGFAWILLVCPWWPSSTSVLVALITGNDEGLSLGLYLLIGNVMVPVFIIFLMLALTEFKYQDRQKLILSIAIIAAMLFWIYLFYFFFTDPGQMGTKKGVVDIEFGGILRIYLLITIALISIVGFLFFWESHKLETADSRLKGIFILIAIGVWVVGTIFDGFLPLTTTTLTIVRLILISSSILFYFGFITPEFIKNIFIKKT